MQHCAFHFPRKSYKLQFFVCLVLAPILESTLKLWGDRDSFPHPLKRHTPYRISREYHARWTQTLSSHCKSWDWSVRAFWMKVPTAIAQSRFDRHRRRLHRLRLVAWTNCPFVPARLVRALVHCHSCRSHRRVYYRDLCNCHRHSHPPCLWRCPYPDEFARPNRDGSVEVQCLQMHSKTPFAESWRQRCNRQSMSTLVAAAVAENPSRPCSRSHQLRGFHSYRFDSSHSCRWTLSSRSQAKLALRWWCLTYCWRSAARWTCCTYPKFRHAREIFHSFFLHNFRVSIVKWCEKREKKLVQCRSRYSRFKVGAAIKCMLVDVVDHRVVQQVLDRESTSDEASRERWWDIVRHPVGDDVNVASIFAEQIGVEDELLGIAAAAGDDDESVLTENGFKLAGEIMQLLVIRIVSIIIQTHIIGVPQPWRRKRLQQICSAQQLNLHGILQLLCVLRQPTRQISRADPV